MKEKIKRKCLIIWSMALISILSIFLVIAHFFGLISNNINECIAYLLIVGCALIIITTIICLTVIICKCLSTEDKCSSSYEVALTKMLVPYDKEGTKDNNNSN